MARLSPLDAEIFSPSGSELSALTEAPLRLHDLLQGGQILRQKVAVAAEVRVRGAADLPPHPFAPAAAEGGKLTRGAELRGLCFSGQKRRHGGAGKQLRDGLLREASERIAVQTVKIARIDAAVCLDDELRRTLPAHAAAAADAERHIVHNVVKELDAAIAPRLIFRQPAAEKDVVEARKAFGRNGIDALPGAVQLVQTGCELHIRQIELKDALPDLLRVAGDLVGERTQDVELHAVTAQKRDRLLDAPRGGLPGGVDAHGVVAVRQQIIGDADQKIVLLQKPAPVLVQMDGVGLKRVVDLNAPVPAVDDLRKRAEIVEPGKRRFAALKRQRDMIAGGEAALDVLQQLPRDLRLHDAEGADAPQRGNVRVEAVFAPQIAQRRRGLEHDRIVFHREPPESSSAPSDRHSASSRCILAERYFL